MSFGSRLLIARNMKGYSLRELARCVDISQTAINKYEKDKMMPNSQVLLKLCECLSVTPDFLFQPENFELKELEYRKKSNLKKCDKSKATGIILDSIGKYLEIEELLGKLSNIKIKKTTITSYEEVEYVASSLRKEWQLGTDVINSVTNIIEEQGIKVMVLELPAGFDGVTCYAKSNKQEYPIIIVSNKLGLERKRFTLLHELGHLYINIAENSGIDLEKACHKFASAFLVPKEKLIELVGNRERYFLPDEIIALKRYFIISASAMISRLYDCNLINEYQYRNLCIHYREWRKTEPQPVIMLDEPQRFRILVLNALSQGLISLSKSANLLGKDMYDMEQELNENYS